MLRINDYFIIASDNLCPDMAAVTEKQGGEARATFSSSSLTVQNPFCVTW